MPNPTRTRARRTRAQRARSDRGAALVEFALIALPLFTLLFGIIEFGWAFFQLNDVRHGVREGVRLAAVVADTTPAAALDGATTGERIAQATCERMDRAQGTTITIEALDTTGDGTVGVGDDITFHVAKPLSQLTMAFDPVLGGVELTETVTTRLEQDPPTTAAGTSDLAVTGWTCLQA